MGNGVNPGDFAWSDDGISPGEKSWFAGGVNPGEDGGTSGGVDPLPEAPGVGARPAALLVFPAASALPAVLLAPRLTSVPLPATLELYALLGPSSSPQPTQVSAPASSSEGMIRWFMWMLRCPIFESNGHARSTTPKNRRDLRIARAE